MNHTSGLREDPSSLETWLGAVKKRAPVLFEESRTDLHTLKYICTPGVLKQMWSSVCVFDKMRWLSLQLFILTSKTESLDSIPLHIYKYT